MKRFLAVVLVLVMLCLGSCQIIDDLFDKEVPIIDNTEASLNHEKIYLYDEGNVPYRQSNHHPASRI